MLILARLHHAVQILSVEKLVAKQFAHVCQIMLVVHLDVVLNV